MCGRYRHRARYLVAFTSLHGQQAAQVAAADPLAHLVALHDAEHHRIDRCQRAVLFRQANNGTTHVINLGCATFLEVVPHG